LKQQCETDQVSPLVNSEYWMLKKIVPSGNLQPMDTKKISTAAISSVMPRSSFAFCAISLMLETPAPNYARPLSGPPEAASEETGSRRFFPLLWLYPGYCGSC